jgi:hypothetical protein
VFVAGAVRASDHAWVCRDAGWASHFDVAA